MRRRLADHFSDPMNIAGWFLSLLMLALLGPQMWAQQKEAWAEEAHLQRLCEIGATRAEVIADLGAPSWEMDRYFLKFYPLECQDTVLLLPLPAGAYVGLSSRNTVTEICIDVRRGAHGHWVSPRAR